ncbi:MAG TPA: TRAP transporter large permease subunit [Hyphomicrobiaceae bacterium]|jgi:tripartite ATP-independent transporter DctM subunit|nr:TRAP transporter large permease subunit [Hyphomicrobiaceae bacterium]
MSVNETLGMIMLFGMVAVIFVGFPISFTLLFLALVFGGLGLGWQQTFDLAYLQIWGTMKDEILPAVPLFIFMGYMTEQAGLMERLFMALRNVLAPVRGALYLAVILTATIFAMATGIVGAAVTVLGIMAGPIMIKTNYDARLSSGAIAAGGTLGILIPPSVMLVVMGPTMGVPVNLLYSAAFGPGFLLAGMYMVYCLVRSFINPALGPPVPVEERVTSPWLLFKEFVIGVVPLTCLIGFTLGTILGGLATPTEAASCGAFGATLLALIYRKLTFSALKNAAVSTMVTSSMVLLLAVASNVFGAVFTKLGAAGLITNTLVGLPWPDAWKLALVMVLIFILGWPFEWPAIVLVFLPIFLPVVEKLQLGMNKLEMMIWFGALVAVNLQTAFLSPPVAMSAYYLRNVVPQWSLATIYKGMADYMVIQLICLAALFMWPEISLWLMRALR